jgi:hypothetical protein
MSAIIAQDLFTDSNGTNLASHTMDTGGGWTSRVGTFQIQGNKATPNSGNDDDQITTDAAADFIMAVDIVPFNLAATEDDPDIIFRWSASNNLWVVHNSSAGGGVQQLYKNIGAGYVLVQSVVFAFVSGTPYTVKVVCVGSLIKTYVNNVQQISASDSFNATATKVGLRTGKAGAPVTLATWDNFIVTTVDPGRVVQVNQSVMNSVSF